MHSSLGGVWKKPGSPMPGSRYGMTNNIPNLGFSTVSLTDWLGQRSAMGGLKLSGRRVFDSGMPSSWANSNAAGADEDDKLVHYWSFKQTDVNGVISGAYDSQLENLAASIPDGTYVASFHEPESNSNIQYFSGGNLGKFVDYSQAVYEPMKRGNPNINVGYVAMAFQWGTIHGRNWPQWYPGDDHCDFLAVDTYNMEFEALRKLRDKSDFLRWHGFAAAEGKPLGIWEYGHTWGSQVPGFPAGGGRTDGQLEPVVEDDCYWAAHNGINTFLFWNCRLLDASDPLDGSREWAISDNGLPDTLAAWNSGVDQYAVGVEIYQQPFGDPFNSAFSDDFGNG